MNSTNVGGMSPPGLPASLSSPAINPSAMLLDTFIPGASVASSFIQQTLKIDIALWLPFAIPLVFLIPRVKNFLDWLSDLTSQHLMSSVDIRVDDEVYNMVMAYIANLDFAKDSRRSVANTNVSSPSWRLNHREDSDDDSDSENEIQIDSNGQPVSKGNKEKGIRYTPTFGTHRFWYKGRILSFSRFRVEASIGMYLSESEEISIKSYGRNPTILREFLADCRLKFLADDLNKTVIYRASSSEKDEFKWTRCASRPTRPLSTVVLDEAIKNDIVDDLRAYIHPDTRKWYANRGIPYRKGYLLYGNPGTGKSSFSFALAGFFKLKIYVVSLGSGKLSEQALEDLFAELPRYCIVLLEDIDCVGMTGDRKSLSQSSPKDKDQKHNISLSSLLNILDGVAAQEGRILIMTTNHIEKLDDALIRPGRIDKKVELGLADTPIIKMIFKSIFATLEGDITTTPSSALDTDNMTKSTSLEFRTAPTSSPEEEAAIAAMADEIALHIPANTFSPAEIQGFFLKHKCQPRAAVTAAPQFVTLTLAEKKKKDDAKAAALAGELEESAKVLKRKEKEIKRAAKAERKEKARKLKEKMEKRAKKMAAKKEKLEGKVKAEEAGGKKSEAGSDCGSKTSQDSDDAEDEDVSCSDGDSTSEEE